jgi:hypothetical protein
LNIAPILRLTFFYIFDYGGPQVSHANKKITTQTKVTAQKQKLMARKQKLTVRKQKLTAQKKNSRHQRKNSRHQRKNSRHQRKTHGTKEKLTAQEHIFSMRGLETDLKQSNKHGGLNKNVKILFKLRGGNSYSSSKLLCLLWR